MNIEEQAALDFLQSDENAAQFLARSVLDRLPTGVPILDRQSAVRGNHVVEICGLAGTGKTEMLYSVLASCVLPPSLDGVSYGGQGSNVLFFDLDSKFDIVRVAEILQSRVAAATHMQAGQEHDAVADVVRSAVGRLHIITCPSSFHLLAALKVIKPIAQELMAQPGGLAAVLVDNVAAHYYSDRAIRGAGSAATGPLWGGSSAALTLVRVHTAMAAGLKQLQLALRVPIIATKHTLTTEPWRSDEWGVRDVMLKPWQDLVTHRLVLRRMGGGGVGAAQSSQSRLVARWIKPDVPVEDRYSITIDGVTPG